VQRSGPRSLSAFSLLAAIPLFLGTVRCAAAQTRAAYPDTARTQTRFELFGQLVTDLIYDFEQNAPA
jgi:hypothetical protein